MSAKGLTFWFGLFALAASAARADIAPESVAPPVLRSDGMLDAATVFAEPGTGLSGAFQGDSGVIPVAATDEVPRWDPDDVRQLPAAPGSASLFLSAVLSIGAWNLVRSAKHLHFNIPEWYHTGAPDKIGSTVAFDLVFNELLPCTFEDVIPERPLLRQPRRDYQWRLKPRICVVDADPRGPPLGV